MLASLNNKILSLESRLVEYEKEIKDLKAELKAYKESTSTTFEKGTYFKFEMDSILFAFSKYSYENFLKREDYVYKTISHEVKKQNRISFVYDANKQSFLCIDEDGNGIADEENTVINTALNLIRNKVSQHTATFYKTAEDNPVYFKNNKAKVDKWKNGVCEVKGAQRDALVNTIVNLLKKVCVIKKQEPKHEEEEEYDTWGKEY